VNKIYLSCLDKKIAGVCGGLGEYFTLDPLLFRIAFIVLAFTAFPSIITYVILWAILGNRK